MFKVTRLHKHNYHLQQSINLVKFHIEHPNKYTMKIHGAASRANPKIPNFKQSIAAARRDYKRRPSAANVDKTSSQDTHFGEKRKGHIDSALRRGSLVAVGADGALMQHHEHPFQTVHKSRTRRQSVTAKLGIRRVDPSTLNFIPEYQQQQ